MCDSERVTFFLWFLYPEPSFAQTQDGFHPHLLSDCAFRYQLVVAAEFRPAVRGWFGVRGFGLLWTPQFAHSQPGPPGGGRTPVHRFLLYLPGVQPVQVSSLHTRLIYGLTMFPRFYPILWRQQLLICICVKWNLKYLSETVDLIKWYVSYKIQWRNPLM